MLLDTVSEYDNEKKHYLLDLRERTILAIANQFDHKKILTFLGKVGIIDIDETKKEVVIWVSNDFILTQIKKNFQKALKEAIMATYNSQFGVRFVVYPPFANAQHELLTDLKKLLNIQQSKASKAPQLEKNLKSELGNYFGILFEPSYRFDTFVAGANNQFAFSAAKAVADAPGTAYNPLFLYGNVGLGKTHLMQAVGNEIMQNFPEKVVIYLPATKLVEEIVQALRMNKMANLMKKFDEVDVLLIDDIQFLADKDKTQEVFHNLFNDFHMKKKQVIILESKLQSKGISIDFEYLSLIAQYIKSNVRELEGALNILITRQQLSKAEISEEDVYSCLKTLGYYCDENQINFEQVMQQNKKSSKNFSTLVEMVAQYYSLSIAELKSDSRKKEITQARQILMLLAKKYFNRTLEKIGDYFWGKNHATAIYAINTIEKKLKSDSEIQHDYRVFVDWIEQ